MKKLVLVILLSLSVLAINAQTVVSTGAGYADDVFYSMENGVVKTESRTNWDLGFSTNRMSVSILSNGGAGTMVYNYTANDTAGWATLDTTGMIKNGLFNAIDSWENGAFSTYSTNHPDYGWGIYNMGSHNIVGDSLYIVKTIGGMYKKLWIIEKDAVNNLWKFKYANLDGTSEQMITVDANTYDTKNFVYFNLDTDAVIDREPASDTWDLLFTKYWDNSIPYAVSGVMTNEKNVTTEEVSMAGVDQATYNTYTESNFMSNISTIGSDWKKFSMTTYTYNVSDTTVYFTKTYNAAGDSLYHKLYFTDFDYTIGEYTFEQSLILHSSINSNNESLSFSTFPNPVNDIVNIELSSKSNGSIIISNLNGGIVKTIATTKAENQNIKIDMSGLASGVYLLEVNNSQSQITKKLIKL